MCVISSARIRFGAGCRIQTQASIDDLVVYVAFGIILGGRLGYVLFYNLPVYLAHPLEIFAVWKGGMSFHGGLIGAMLGIILFARRLGVPILSRLWMRQRPRCRSASHSAGSPISSNPNFGGATPTCRGR